MKFMNVQKLRRNSFADKLKAGWKKEELMEYYGLDEKKYNKILDSLERLRSRKCIQ